MMPDDEVPASPAPEQVLSQENAALKGKLVEYERLMLDPSYLEYLAERGKAALGRTAPDRAPERREIDFDQMSNKDMVEYLKAHTDGRLRQEIEPIQQTQQFRDTLEDVRQTAEKYEDFWNYKDAMTAIANSKPGLTAEDAYHIAKGQARGRPAPKAPKAEPPGGGGNTKATEKPTKGFEDHFRKAWSAAGLPRQ